SSRIAGSPIAVLDPPVPTSNRPLRSFCERRFHNKPCGARAWFPPVFSGGRRSSALDSVTRSCQQRGRLLAKTIPDSGNADWSISSAGSCHHSLSDSASPDPSRLAPPRGSCHFSSLRLNFTSWESHPRRPLVDSGTALVRELLR